MGSNRVNANQAVAANLKVDASGVAVPVTDNGGSLTVDGTVAVTGVATETTLAAGNVLEGAVTETAPATDTASSGLNGRLQRIAQRLTSIIALLPTALGSGGGLKVDGSGTALPVSGTVTATVGTVTAVTSITNVVHVDDNAGSLTVDYATTGRVPGRPSRGTADQRHWHHRHSPEPSLRSPTPCRLARTPSARSPPTPGSSSATSTSSAPHREPASKMPPSPRAGP